MNPGRPPEAGPSQPFGAAAADERHALARRAPMSLRLRLLLMLLSTTCAVWIAAAWWSYRDARHEAEELLDAQLAQSVRMLSGLIRHELLEGAGHLETLEIGGPAGGDLHPYEQKLQFRVSDLEGRPLLTSATPPPPGRTLAEGYADLWHHGEGWRVLVVALPEPALRVEVAQSLAIRDELATHVALRLALPLVMALPALGLLIAWSLGRGLQPLQRLAQSVAARTPVNLAALQTAHLPAEVLPLGLALNNLLGRLDRALAAERRFTADAAHELRTPLAAIQMHAQVAQAGGDAPLRARALDQVVAGTRRAAHLVDELLRLERLDPMAGLPDPQPVALDAVARRVVEELLPGADVQRLVFDFDALADTAVDGDADLLQLALRNLVDNALRYSPPGSEVTLQLRRDAAGLCLAVIDHGPGVADDELPRLAERFFRGRGVAVEGSGLGLAIVQRIADLHGARLQLGNRPGGGLQAALVWP